MTYMAAIPIYGKTLDKSPFHERVARFKTWYNCRFKLIMFCSNDYAWLALTYFTARSNFATLTFIWENITMMNSLKIITSCDMDMFK